MRWLSFLLLVCGIGLLNGSSTGTQERRTGQENKASPAEAHWYEPANSLGLEIFTHEKLSWMAPDAVGLRYTGQLRCPLADQLRQLLLSELRKYTHVILELDSDGGEVGYVKGLVSILKDVRNVSEFTTRVMEGSCPGAWCRF